MKVSEPDFPSVTLNELDEFKVTDERRSDSIDTADSLHQFLSF